MKHEAILHHPLADIRITAIVKSHAPQIKRIICSALDNYLEETTIAASIVHSETKTRHGSAYKTPGYYLRIYRTRADFTQAELAKRLHIRQHHLSEMEHNKRPIGKALAHKLAEVLRCDYHKFL